jgi:hypothetical protein
MNIPKFADRLKEPNKGEILFEAYCASKGYKFNRLGFDEHKSEVSNFYHLNHLIRNLPDYVVHTENCSYVVQVKGTDNFKKKEIDLLPLFLEWYSAPKAPLVYAFCFEGCDPLLKYPDQIIRLYEKSIDQRWDDGVVYRCLNLR